ncbi:MAG: type II 3-dehydroquinate dehydratase [Burkholderiales bacterium]
MTKPLYILNRPNLNRLGKREPAIYGKTTLAEIEAQCRDEAGPVPVEFRQSNSEAQLIDWIHVQAIQNPIGRGLRSRPGRPQGRLTAAAALA